MPTEKIQIEAEAALKRIAVESRSSIDDVLDIMRGISCRESPGECMLCYFNLQRKLPARCLPDLYLVKSFLEREIDVVATDESVGFVNAFQFKIAEQALDDFCQRVMEESKTLLRPGMDKLLLEFRFSG